MGELQRVLAALAMDTTTHHDVPGVIVHAQRKSSADAARVIREMAADFARHARCSPACRSYVKCICGLDAARAKWRLEP